MIDDNAPCNVPVYVTVKKDYTIINPHDLNEENSILVDATNMMKNKQGFYLSSCCADHTRLQKLEIHYQAALHSRGQYKDGVYIIVDKGTLQELAVEHSIGLAKLWKQFLHYGGNTDDLSVNEGLVIYYQLEAFNSVWYSFIHVYQLLNSMRVHSVRL